MASMLSERAHDALLAMQDNALRWTDAADERLFADDRARFYAVTRCMEIVSEASRRLPDDLLARHPHYPWRNMRDAGNVYRHVYEGVAEGRLFQDVRTHLPPLLAIVEAELSQ